MNAKDILEEVRAFEIKKAEETGHKRFSREEEAPFREWKVKRYTEAIALDPTFGDAYAERGSELYFLGRRKEAKDDMRKAFELGVSEPHLYETISMAFEGEEKRVVLRAGMRLVDRTSVETGWFYDHIYSSFIRSYWYDGNFSEFVRLLEEWTPQLDPAGHMFRHSLQDLAMGYAALDNHTGAEAAYRRAWGATPSAEKQHVANMIIRARMHRNDYAGARAALEEIGDHLPEHTRSIFDAALLVLLNAGSGEAKKASTAVLSTAEEQGRHPGPLGNKTNYYSFLLGIIYKGAGRDQEAAEILKVFADESAANKREWGITMRWEIAKAYELASALSTDNE